MFCFIVSYLNQLVKEQKESRKKVGKNIDKAKLGNYTNSKAWCSHATIFIVLASSNKEVSREFFKRK